MALKKTPVKGTADMLPADVRLRQHVIGMIRESYSKYGFMEIETPVMEHIENLTSNQGGDNEKLIFKIMKRGADLMRALDKGSDLADSGLRYDLTLPLARYYANNKDILPAPFKALQIGNVWRADKPQKGRFRQFTQCDIDILGDKTNLAEIELIGATSDMLCRIFSEFGIKGFTVHISDRRLLISAALSAGFTEEEIPGVLITLDKLDKIGTDGVRAELIESGASEETVDKYMSIYERYSDRENAHAGAKDEAGRVLEFAERLGSLEDGAAEGLSEIIRCADAMTDDSVSIVFDPTLVRGMGYYTGTIFEVTIDGYGFSIAGGGRYDRMIGRFAGNDTPACGFSIGFERIITILKDTEQGVPGISSDNLAVLIDKKVTGEDKIKILREAKSLREQGRTVVVQPMQKNMGHQIQMLEEQGYTEFRKVWNDKD